MIPPKRYESEPRKRKAYVSVWNLLFFCVIKQRSEWNWEQFQISVTEAKEIFSRAKTDILGKSGYDYVY